MRGSVNTQSQLAYSADRANQYIAENKGIIIDYKKLERTSDFNDAINVEFYESNLGFSYKVLKNSGKQSLIRKIFKK